MQRWEFIFTEHRDSVGTRRPASVAIAYRRECWHVA